MSGIWLRVRAARAACAASAGGAAAPVSAGRVLPSLTALPATDGGIVWSNARRLTPLPFVTPVICCRGRMVLCDLSAWHEARLDGCPAWLRSSLGLPPLAGACIDSVFGRVASTSSLTRSRSRRPACSSHRPLRPDTYNCQAAGPEVARCSLFLTPSGSCTSLARGRLLNTSPKGLAGCLAVPISKVGLFSPTLRGCSEGWNELVLPESARSFSEGGAGAHRERGGVGICVSVHTAQPGTWDFVVTPPLRPSTVAAS